MLGLRALPLRQAEAPVSEPGARSDGRELGQVRPLRFRTGIVLGASGSAILEMARTKVVCSVFGPRATESHDYSEHGQLECSLSFASFARRDRRRSGVGSSPEERALSLDMAAALSSSVRLRLLPKSSIAVHALVLQDDGGALPAAINCASLALADACICLYGMVAACTCAVLGELEVALDCSAAELDGSAGAVSLAYMPTNDQLTLLRHDGSVPFELVADEIALALSGCTLLHAKMAEALRPRRAATPDAIAAPQDSKRLGDGAFRVSEGRHSKVT